MQPRACRVPEHPAIRLSPSVSRCALGKHTLAWAALLAIVGTLMTNGGHAQPSAKWYYCVSANAYYPYVKTCPGGWREDNPYGYGPGQAQATAPPAEAPTAPTWVAPAPVASPSETQPSAAFQQGQADRQTWEVWFNSQSGDYRAGAYYWSGQRSLLYPGSCTESAPSGDWTAGCFAAQQKLAAPDVRRKIEPEYRLGWNNPPTVDTTPPIAEAQHGALAAAPPNAPSLVPPSTLTGRDIPRLLREFDSDPGGEAFLNKYGETFFSDVGEFLEFANANLPKPLWMVSVNLVGGQAVCFYDHFDADLANMNRNQMVRISGTVGLPLKKTAVVEGTMVLAKNCSVTPSESQPPSTPLPPDKAGVGNSQTTTTVATSAWYIAHIGTDTCVQISDIGDHGQRVYYGAGSMRTPEDVAQMFRNLGASVMQDKYTQEGTVRYHVSMGTDKTIIQLFNEQSECHNFMEHIDR
jgi:hypothetical protein